MMKLSLSFNFLSIAIVFLSLSNLQADAALANNQSFEQWCVQKNSLPAETRKTVELLLKKSGTQDCKLADSKLNTLSEIYLHENQLFSDEINLPENQISDIKPIASLRNLTRLSLSFNQISDIRPLSGLTKLTTLFLIDNQISDIQPLTSLTNLTELHLSFNKISDIGSLSQLKRLTRLELQVNQIRDVTPLRRLTKLTQLNLFNNQISNVKPLASLTNLIFLIITNNPISEKICPVKPESICRF
jgi:internalin A